MTNSATPSTQTVSEPQREKRKRDPDEPFLGRAIENGIVRFTSAKQITLFDAQSEGGCPRKWAFEYVFGKKLKKTGAFVEGIDYAEKLEHYLKTGEEVLPPILQPAKKFFPTPRNRETGLFDLEVEQAFAPGPKGLGKEIELAIKEREQLLSIGNTFMHKVTVENLKAAILKHAGLVIHDIPVDGAADVRHCRGEFIDEEGKLRKEPKGYIVVETGDLKSTSRIHPHRIMKGENAGTILPGYAKTAAEVCDNVQMVLYGLYGHGKYPDATHHRLSHYYANKTKKEAAKRTGLISVAQVLEKSQRIAGVVLKMTEVAGVQKIQDVEPNLYACDTYTHVDPDDPKGERTLPGCGHRYYCPLSSSQISMGLFGYNEEHKIMGLSAFDTLDAPANGANGTQQSAPVPQLDAATYAAQLEAEKQKLAVQVGVCTLCAAPLMANNSSRLQDGRVVHIGCPRAAVAPPPPSAPVSVSAPSPPVVAPPPPAVEGAVGVRPPDAPTVDWIDSAKPLPPEEIARVEDPALRAKLEEHRRLWLEREAQKAAANPVPAADVKWCQPQCPRVVITAEILTAKKYICHCGKSYSVTMLKPIQDGDKLVSVIPKHKPVNKLEVTPPPPSLPAAPPSQLSLPQAPPPPVEVAPPPPVEIAPPPPPSAPPPPRGEMTDMVEKMFGPPNATNGSMQQQVTGFVQTVEAALEDKKRYEEMREMVSRIIGEVVDTHREAIDRKAVATIARAIISALEPLVGGAK
jgi:hypothetical protein